MAKNYILAEYRNETRKIEGDWSKKKFNELVSAVKSRFGIEQQVDFKIFDKGANTYFIIDRSEMRELRKGALVKVVNAKGGRKATKAATRKSGDARNDSRGGRNDNNGRKGRKGGNLPPGVPAYSKADDSRRNNWNVGSQVELFSDRASKWVKGKIIDVFHDHEGEWLLVEYQGFRQKEIQRFSNYVRSVSRDGGDRRGDRGDSRDNGRAERKKKEDPMKRKRREKGDERETRGGDRDGGRKDRDGGRGGRKEEKREKREKKKVTTQSKFRKRRVEDEAERETAENEIQLKGNSNNLKQYIDRAAILLRGPLPKTEEDLAEEAEAKAAAEEAAKVKAEEEAKAAEEAEAKAGDDDAKVESEEKEKKVEKRERKERGPRGPAPPSKKFDVVYLVGIGRAMGHVVSCVELIKRIVPGLHQTTELETVEFKDVYEPTEEGLENVEVSRFVTRLKVTLAVSGKDLDSASLGYQAPIAPDEFAANIEYKYPDEQRQKRRAKGRGRRRQREEKKAAAAGGQ